MAEKYLRANGIELAYDEFGESRKPVILLIMGLGTQMIAWPEEFAGTWPSGAFASFVLTIAILVCHRKWMACECRTF